MMAMFMVGAVTAPTILPMFIRRVERNDAAGARGQLNAWGSVFLLVLSVASLLAFLMASSVARLLAPGFDAETQALCTSMLRVMIPLSVLMGMLPFVRVVLNAGRIFTVPPLAELLMKIAMLLVLVMFVKSMGAHSLVVGAVVGVVLAVAFQLWMLWNSWLSHPVRPRFSDPDFRFVMLLMLAPALGTAFSQFGSIIENAAASTLESGSVAALSFARRLVNVPLLVVPLATGTVLFTYFAKLVHSAEHESSSQLLAGGIRSMLFIFVPLTVLTCVLAEPIVALVYQRGSFNSDSTRLVSRILFWLAPSMCLYSVEMILMRHFFAREDIWTPILIGMGCVLLKIAIIWFGVGEMGVLAVVGGIVIGRTVKVGLLVWFTCTRARITVRQLGALELIKLLPAAVLTAGISLVVLDRLTDHVDPTVLGRLIILSISCGLSGAGYLLTTYLLKSRDCLYIVDRLTWWKA